jgi:glycosyltransferase involved in cell wall biosynthesis
MKKVTIFQYRLFHYRVKLLELLRQKCAVRGIELVIVHGQPFGDEIKKRDTGVLSWATPVKNWYFPIKEKKDLCWQPLPREARNSDLLVFMHENRLLANYWWLLRRRLGLGPKVAFWGHGRDFQSCAPSGWRERWKKLSLTWPDWWFAYTALTEKILLAARFDPARITVLQNAIDNQAFADELAAVDDDRLQRTRLQWALGAQDFVALYCGSLYQDKRLDLLLEACSIVQARLPGFRLLLAGDGAMRQTVEDFCRNHPWAHYLGAQYGLEKAALFRLARVSLCPGAVGLNILDSFVAGTPMLTRIDARHGPEIAFLESGVNGFAVDGELAAYAAELEALVRDPARLLQARLGALLSAEKYTVEHMAERFACGLTTCLNADSV